MLKVIVPQQSGYFYIIIYQADHYLNFQKPVSLKQINVSGT